MTVSNTVWVVDDERSIRWVIERALSREGFNVSCFDDAESMLRALDHSAPDAIVSDIRMPGISGLDLLERVGAVALAANVVREQGSKYPARRLTAVFS